MVGMILPTPMSAPMSASLPFVPGEPRWQLRLYSPGMTLAFASSGEREHWAGLLRWTADVPNSGRPAEVAELRKTRGRTHRDNHLQAVCKRIGADLGVHAALLERRLSSPDAVVADAVVIREALAESLADLGSCPSLAASADISGRPLQSFVETAWETLRIATLTPELPEWLRGTGRHDPQPPVGHVGSEAPSSSLAWGQSSYLAGTHSAVRIAMTGSSPSSSSLSGFLSPTRVAEVGYSASLPHLPSAAGEPRHRSGSMPEALLRGSIVSFDVKTAVESQSCAWLHLMLMLPRAA